ncbi:MAG: hypothetical protein ACYDAQ_01075 [Mycobacteriales bacterium]
MALPTLAGRPRRLVLTASGAAMTLLAACAGVAHHAPAGARRIESRAPAPAAAAGTASASASPVDPGQAPTLAPGVFAIGTVGSVPVVTVRRVAPAGPGQGPISVAVFNSARTRLVLHPGSLAPAAGQGKSWVYGPQVSAQERQLLLAAFNAGFKMAVARGGWVSQGRTLVPLVPGAASVVIYANGTTDIGAWGREVPAPNERVVSVRQNLQLLIDGGRAQHIDVTSEAQLEQWWGVAYLGAPLVARSALGITASGSLVWAAGTDITVAALADALLAQGVQRALELDINAPLARGFLYAGPAAITASAPLEGGMLPLVVGQVQPGPGQPPSGALAVPHCTYLTTCSRDFFTVLIAGGGRGAASALGPR